jgi:aspartyl-tRNA(Asn)/glutamyl-tRNA(Gln) amidotransferase subunit A
MSSNTNNRLIKNPGQLRELAAQIANKSLTSVDLVQRCLDRIADVDGEVQAWIKVDGERALREAHQCDREAQQGQWRGPLHGIPVGVKDVIDVAGLPTLCGSKSRVGRPNPTADAEIVAAIKAAGGIVLGKLHTTEFAFFDAPPTRNPHNLKHTPGGSSSGSGAGVASGTVPLALGTQTFGSVNRPAAYCGIAAFKPSTRSLSTFGVNPLAPYTDTVGFFGWSVDDAVSFYEIIRPAYIGRDAGGAPVQAEVLFAEDPLLDDASPEAIAACKTMHESFAGSCKVASRRSPVSMTRVVDLLKSVMTYELAHIYGDLANLPAGMVGQKFLEAVHEGKTISDERYRSERNEIDRLRATFFQAFDRNTVFLWPAAPGPAPEGIVWTGDPRYIAAWTALGGPIVTIPAGLSASGLPLACILAGAPGSDIAMCRLARQLTVGERLACS